MKIAHRSRLSTLRPDQVGVREQLLTTVSEGYLRFVLQAPTGYGKTLQAADLLAMLLASGQRSMFVVPALTLIDQSFDGFVKQGITEIGVIQGQHQYTDISKPIQIASAQTLDRRDLKKLGHFDYILIDEVHRYYKVYDKLQEHFPDTVIIGLSATPWSKGLGKRFKKLIIASTTQQCIEDKLLVPFRHFAPASPDLKGVHTLAGEYKQDELSDAMNKSALVADTIETYKSIGENRPAFCFAVDRVHAAALMTRFNEAGVPAEYIDAFTPVFERNKIRDRLHSGETKVVCNVGCLTTGVDWDVRCIVLARPTKSEMLYVQMIGRGLRLAPGKTDCLILDHSDNHTRFGFVTDVHHDELDDGEPKRATAEKQIVLPKKCFQCAFLKPPKTLQCPNCGAIPVPKCTTVHRDGELIELSSRDTAKEPVYTYAEMDDWCAGFNYIVRERRNQGRPLGKDWTYANFIAKFKRKPPFHTDGVAPREPTYEMRAWVSARARAYYAKKNAMAGRAA